ncbi:MAG: penicillin-binding protein [Thermoleophilaceae bacterium]|nr:penicillin-binding protein [Thermoleophilaceae bacterium]
MPRNRRPKPTPSRRASARQASSRDRDEAIARPRVKKLRLLFIVAGIMVLAGISMIFGLMMAVASDLPRLEDREQYRVAKQSTLVDDQGKPITVLRNNENRILVKPGEISASMKQAVVAIEDKRFYEHQGIDFRGIGRALYADTIGGSARQGASTITQQFVKNALVAGDNRTVLQKLKEAALAYHLERQWSKEKVLNEYLNTIYYGNGAYGIEAAAETYFGKEAHPGCKLQHTCAAELQPWEAALLAGVIASPSGYDPVADPEASMLRRNQVLRNMLDQGYLTASIYRTSIAKAVPSEFEIETPKEDSAAPYFSSWIRQQLVDRYGAGPVFGGGLTVHTTLDLDMQRAAEQAITGTLPYGGPTASLVAIENKTGKIKAMVGGFDYATKPFNLATQGRRQPGSSFKTFALMAALKRGIPLSKTLESSKIERRDLGFEVNNYEDRYAGITTLLDATIHSDNTAYVRLARNNVGLQRVTKMAHEMGVETALSKNVAMVLGGLRVGVTPMEMAYAYSTLANNGKRTIGSLGPAGGGPVAIDKVTQGKRLFRKQRDHTSYKRVFNEAVAREGKIALGGVVTSGTGKRAAIGSFAAGKTGTTENYGDAWFVGFGDELTVAIWVGYPDKTQPMLTEFGGQPVAGGTFPAIIWHNFMLQAMQIIKLHELNKGKDATGTTGVTTPSTPGYSGTEPTSNVGNDGAGTNNTAPETPKPDKPKATKPDRKPATPDPVAPPPAGNNGTVSPGGGTAPG